MNSPFTKAAFDEGVQDLLKGNVTCDVNEHGPPTRGQLADALDLVPKTVQFHLRGSGGEGDRLCIANLLIFHKLTDLDTVGDSGSAMRALASSLLANAETRIIYRQESDQLGVTAQTLGLTGTEQRLLPTLGTGQGLWRIKDRSFVIQHQLHPSELATFDTTGRMTGDAPFETTDPSGPTPAPRRSCS